MPKVRIRAEETAVYIKTVEMTDAEFEELKRTVFEKDSCECDSLWMSVEDISDWNGIDCSDVELAIVNEDGSTTDVHKD